MSSEVQGETRESFEKRAAAALARGAEYLSKSATAIDACRLRALEVDSEERGKELLERLVAELNLPEDAATAGVDPYRLLEVFAVADELDLIRCEELLPLVRHLSASQSDGVWFADSGLTDDEQLFINGMLAGYLNRTFRFRSSQLAAASRQLSAAWSPERLQTDHGPCWDFIAAFAHFYALFPDDLSDELLQRCGRELDRGYRMQLFNALDVARVFQLCEGLAFPGMSATAIEIRESILALQRDDGSWLSEVSARGDVRASTFLAIAALRRFANLVRD